MYKDEFSDYGTDILKLIEEEERKDEEAARQERIWKEKEYRMYASSSCNYKFGISGPNAYVEETQKRLALIFSRYFRAANSRLSSYDVALQFFKTYKTSWIRWNNLPTELHLKDVWMETPFYLKHMPNNCVDFAKLAKKVIPVIMRVDPKKFSDYVDKVEKMYKEQNMYEFDIEKFQKTPYNDYIDEKQKLCQEHDDVYEDFDSEYGNNNWKTVRELEKINAQVKLLDGKMSIRNNLIKFRDMKKRLRKDFTLEEYKEYQKERKSKKFVNPLDEKGNPIDDKYAQQIPVETYHLPNNPSNDDGFSK